MQPCSGRLGLALAALIAAACTGDGAGGERDGGSELDAGMPGTDGGSEADGGSEGPCVFARTSSVGMACAVAPSATGAGIVDDFGHHALALPAAIGPDTPVYVHFVGTRGKPANAATEQFPNLPTLLEGAQAGYVVLMVAYPNAVTIGSLCGDDVDCYEPVRLEVLRGVDAPAPYGERIDVTPPNDIESRLEALVPWLLATGLLGPTPPDALAGGEVDWARARVGGHSQGGGHAAVLARHRAVERLCMLSSPLDGTSAGAAVTYAAATGWVTPPAARRGVIHEGDRGFAKAEANYQAMGLTVDLEYRVLTDATSDPHAFTVKSDAASAVAARHWGCFER